MELKLKNQERIWFFRCRGFETPAMTAFADLCPSYSAPCRCGSVDTEPGILLTSVENLAQWGLESELLLVWYSDGWSRSFN